MIRRLTLLLAASLLLSACGETSQESEPVAAPLPPLPKDAQLIAGRYFYYADAAVFTGCHTGQRWPVASRHAAVQLERAFLDAKLPAGESMVVTVHGKIDLLPGMEPDTQLPHLVVYRIEEAPAELACPIPTASLEGRRWELVRWHQGSEALPDTPPWIALRQDGSTHGYSGCNRFNGDYRLLESSLEFGPLAATRMACAETGMALERRFLEMLHRSTRFEQQGDEITLYAGDRALITLRGVALQ